MATAQATCTENYHVWYVVFEICQLTERHTDMLTAIHCTPPRRKVNITLCVQSIKTTLFFISNIQAHI